MGVFSLVEKTGHEQILYGHDPKSGLRTIIAIHSTALGPALGGTRFYPYANEDEALQDVLRLSRGMTLKAAAAGLDLGGGKAVIIGDPHRDKSERLWRAYGRMVDSLNGRYITAEDVGTTALDLAMVRRETRWASGIPVEEGGSGDPSPATAIGLLAALKAIAEFLWGSEDLKGRRVAIGCGEASLAFRGSVARRSQLLNVTATTGAHRDAMPLYRSMASSMSPVSSASIERQMSSALSSSTRSPSENNRATPP